MTRKKRRARWAYPSPLLVKLLYKVRPREDAKPSTPQPTDTMIGGVVITDGNAR